MSRKIFEQYRNIIAYLFFGVCTTIINIVSYFICAHILQLNIIISTIISWILAVMFAFFTNKAWVFESKCWKKEIVLKELFYFFLCRITTGLLDLVIMLVSVNILHWNDMIMKAISNIVVIILNYIASKFVFLKKK